MSDLYDPESFPFGTSKGSLANLSALRNTDAATRAAFFEERNTNPVALEANVPAVLLDGIPAKVQLGSSSGTEEEEEIFGDNDEEEAEGDADSNDNDNGDTAEPLSAEPTNNDSTMIEGEIFVTNTQVLFVATQVEDAEHDLAIGGACVVLHAMTDDDDDDAEPSVYLQLDTTTTANNDGSNLSEVTLIPNNNNDNSDNNNNCQRLFDALCKLISLHPILDDDDDEINGMMTSGGMIGGGFGDNPFGDYGEMVWAPPPSDEATPAEREAMLERLDNLLVVAPGLEKQEQPDEEENNDGRFDDAPETS